MTIEGVHPLKPVFNLIRHIKDTTGISMPA